MSDFWTDAKIRKFMNKAVTLAKAYEKDKTEPNRKAAFEHAHKSVILGRYSPVLTAELQTFVKLVSPYFGANERSILEGALKRLEPLPVPEKWQVIVHHDFKFTEAELLDDNEHVEDEKPEKSKQITHDNPKFTEAELGADKEPVEDENPKKLKPIIHNSLQAHRG